MPESWHGSLGFLRTTFSLGHLLQWITEGKGVMRESSRLVGLAVILFAAYPAILILVATANGPGISIDSVSYAAAANSWADSGRLLGFNGESLSIFPGGMPVVVGTFMWMGVDGSVAVSVINALAIAMTVLATYFLGRQVLRKPGWSLLAAGIVSLATSTVRVGSYFWTEPVFTALITWALVLTVWAVRIRTVSWWLPIAVGLLVSASSSYRFVGIVALPVLAAGVLWASQSRRWVNGLTVVLVGSVGFVGSVARNLILGAPAFGDRSPGSVDAQGAVLGLVNLWGEYIAPSTTTSLTAVFGAVVLVLLVAGAWLLVMMRSYSGIVTAAFVAVYWVAILASQVGTRLDVATERFGAPALAPSVVVFLVAIRALLDTMSRQIGELVKREQGTVHSWISVIAAVLLLAVVGLSSVHTMRFVTEARTQGLGIASAASMDSAVARLAQGLPSGAVVASNDPWRVWWARGTGVVLDYPPTLVEWPMDRVESDIARLVRAVGNEGSALVLIDEQGRASLPLSQLAQRGLTATEIGTEDGVTLWELAPAN